HPFQKEYPTIVELEATGHDWTRFEGRWGYENLGDAALKSVKKLLSIGFLDLFGACEARTVTDAGLKNLAKVTSLERICLGWSTTDAGLQHLAGLLRLRELRLDNASVTDKGLRHLKRLTKLERLSLQYAQVTDAGLKAI